MPNSKEYWTTERAALIAEKYGLVYDEQFLAVYNQLVELFSTAITTQCFGDIAQGTFMNPRNGLKKVPIQSAPSEASSHLQINMKALTFLSLADALKSITKKTKTYLGFAALGLSKLPLPFSSQNGTSSQTHNQREKTH